jgi:CheY-like chemotaxis protein
MVDLPEGSYVRLSVKDTGCGMDRRTLDQIFDPFFTTKVPGEATGLGLSVVHGIVTNHGGSIRVYSEQGKGTAFHMYFPAAETVPEATPKAVSGDSRQRSEHILYVDDEEGLVLLASRLLKRLGYRVSGYVDASLALEEFRRRPGEFDAVVTDLSMPRMSGFDLAEQVLAIRPNIPVVISSGYLRPEDQDIARRIGVHQLIQKPYTVEQLEKTFDLYFDRATASAEPPQP